jgi:hypothetical protein
VDDEEETPAGLRNVSAAKGATTMRRTARKTVEDRVRALRRTGRARRPQDQTPEIGVAGNCASRRILEARVS